VARREGLKPETVTQACGDFPVSDDNCVRRVFYRPDLA
jgi:hypothetical protein